MQVTTGVDEREYDKWKLSLEKARLTPTYLLVPTKKEFAKKGLCGNTGTLTVILASPRSTIPTITISSVRKF